MRTALLVVALLWCGASIAGEKAQVVRDGDKPAQEDGVVCERKKVLGSNRTERVCMAAAQRTAAKEKAQSDLQRLGRCSGNDSLCSGTL
ncbi:hypothetical protein [Lysobacter olei]